MRIDAGQHMRMDQRMKLSPRMIQSMEILQLPALALEERIEQEMEQNPVLDLDQEQETEAEDQQQQTDADGGSAQDEGAAPGSEDEKPLAVGEEQTGDAAADFNRAADLNEQYSEDWAQNTQESADYHTPMRPQDNGEPDAKMEAMANTASRGPSLAEQLLDQWRFADVDEPTLKAGEHLIEFIDDDGYLRTDMDQIARQAPPQVTRQQLDRALPLVQRELEPAGLGARDLTECLSLQIDAIEHESGPDEELEIARRIVTEHMKDLEMNRLPQIAKRTGCELEQVKAALERLKRLDPKPGRRLAPEAPHVIVPDLIVEYDAVEDRYVVGLNRGRQPDLRINPGYRKLARDRNQDKQTRQYLARSMSDARWLIDAVQQRNNTILRVAGAVIEAQRDFLDQGAQHLKPLPMVQVAEQLGLHVGTVSRAVAEKHIQTPRGIFPLRMFFSGGTESDSGDQLSWTAVQAKLKEIIDEEDPTKPYSDDALVRKLREAGLQIARRTVAKYRQQLNIPPARRRKQY